MNKHRLYWSTMGIEPSTEKRAEDIKVEQKRLALEYMIKDSTLSWDDSFQELASLLVSIQKDRKNKIKL